MSNFVYGIGILLTLSISDDRFCKNRQMIVFFVVKAVVLGVEKLSDFCITLLILINL